MLTYVLFWYIGVCLSAPTWYFVVAGIGFTCKLFQFGMSMYKAGAEN